MAETSTGMSTNFTESQYFQYLETEFNRGCDGIFRTQIWVCRENGTSFTLGILASVILVIGFIANTAAIVKIPCILRNVDSTLKYSFLVTVLCLAVSDLLALVATYVNGYIREVIVDFGIGFGAQLFCSVMTSHSAMLHILLLCAIRRAHLTQPEKSDDPKFKRTARGLPVMCWTISLAVAAVFTVPVVMNLQSMSFSSEAEFLAILNVFSRQHLYFRFYVSGLPIVLLLIYFISFKRSESYSSCGDKITKRKYKVISLIAIFYALCALEDIVFGIICIIQEETTLNIISISEYRFFHGNQVSWVANYSIKPILFLLAVTPFTDVIVNGICLGHQKDRRASQTADPKK